MQRVRGAAVAAMGLAAVFGLGACTANPGTAATVSHSRVKVSQVNSAIAALDARQGGSIPATQYGDARQQVAATYTFLELAKRYAADQGYPAPTVDYATAASTLKLPQSDAFTRTWAEAVAYQTLLTSRAQPAQPSEAELQVMFHELVAAGLQATQADYPAVRQALLQLSGLKEAVGVRRELIAAIARYHVNVNPMYQPLAYTLFDYQNVPLVTLPLGVNATNPATTG